MYYFCTGHEGIAGGTLVADAFYTLWGRPKHREMNIRGGKRATKLDLDHPSQQCPKGRVSVVRTQQIL